MLPFHWPGGLLSRRNAPRRRAERNRFRFAGETLEPRLLLSGRGVAPHVPAEVGTHAGTDNAAPFHEMQLAIVGTSISYDAMGLPSEMTGEVFYAGGMFDGVYAGTYQEDLTPILHPDYGFVGTTGESVFRFEARPGRSGRVGFGEITTFNQSFIVGMDALTGAVHVASSGQIVASSGLFSGVEGGFTSSSTVMLGVQFALSTQVNFSMEFSTADEAELPGWARHRDGLESVLAAAFAKRHDASESNLSSELGSAEADDDGPVLPASAGHSRKHVAHAHSSDSHGTHKHHWSGDDIGRKDRPKDHSGHRSRLDEVFGDWSHDLLA